MADKIRASLYACDTLLGKPLAERIYGCSSSLSVKLEDVGNTPSESITTNSGNTLVLVDTAAVTVPFKFWMDSKGYREFRKEEYLNHKKPVARKLFAYLGLLHDNIVDGTAECPSCKASLTTNTDDESSRYYDRHRPQKATGGYVYIWCKCGHIAMYGAKKKQKS